MEKGIWRRERGIGERGIRECRNRSGSSWESLRLSPRTLRDSAGPKPQQSAGARESHRHAPGTADPTRSRLAAPGDNCGVKGLPWATGLGFPQGLFQGKTWKHREQARPSLAEQGGKEGWSRIPVPRSAERVDPHGRKPNVEQHVENGLGGRKQAEKSRNLRQSGKVREGEVMFPPVLLLQDSG